MERNPELNNLKPVKDIEKFAHDQFDRVIIFYKRKGIHAICHCSECGEYYDIRTETTGDPFEDDLARIEKPKRNEFTECRLCHREAVYKPMGSFKDEWEDVNICVGQKIDDNRFVFRMFYAMQHIRKNCQTYYTCEEVKRIFTENKKKPVRYCYNRLYGWIKSTTGDTYSYIAHPSTFKQIKKTGMYKYVPTIPFELSDRYNRDSWVLDYYIAAARYPDMEMIVKTGMTDLARNLMMKWPTNFNPRGREIHDRLRINKDRIKPLAEAKGTGRVLKLYQIERKAGKHWTDKELKIVDKMLGDVHISNLNKMMKYVNPIRLKHYFEKQGIWYGQDQKKYFEASQKRGEYFDYIRMRAELGYDMTDDIILYPKDIHRRHNEVALESETSRLDKRKEEVLKRFPSIAKKYKKFSDKYSAAAAGYIIRPAKDAAEIVTEGRVLHHCVGGDAYLLKHNRGQSFILFLRKAADPDMPFITVEIRDCKIIQWYGAYDKKPDEKYFTAWLETYIKELKKRESKKETEKSAKTA